MRDKQQGNSNLDCVLRAAVVAISEEGTTMVRIVFKSLELIVTP